MMASKTILLVEDNPDDVALTLRAFKRYKGGVQVVVKQDGVEALDYLFKQGTNSTRHLDNIPQLILLDLKLPKLNGIEVLKYIRSDERTKFVPVVMLSSSLEDQDLLNCYNYGCNSYIRKPIDFIHFTEVVQQLGIYWLNLNEYPPQTGEEQL